MTSALDIILKEPGITFMNVLSDIWNDDIAREIFKGFVEDKTNSIYWDADKEPIKQLLENCLPCPFCGQKNLVCEDVSCEEYNVICLDCNTNGPFAENKRAAVAAWNKRNEQ